MYSQNWRREFESKREINRYDIQMSVEEYFYQGQHLEDCGDPFEAAKYYAECVEIVKERSNENSERDRIVASYAHNSLSGLYLDASTNEAKQGAMREDSELVNKTIHHANEAILLWKENLMAYINLGNVYRALGRLKEAQRYFQSASSVGMKMNLNEEEDDDDWSNTWIKEPQRRSLSISFYMLALCRSIGGDHEAALNPLKKFGIRYRISPHIWKEVNSPSSSSSSSSSTIKTHLARQYANAVPKAIGEKLRCAFSPTSNYWDATSYNDRGYFSFWYVVGAREYVFL